MSAAVLSTDEVEARWRVALVEILQPVLGEWLDRRLGICPWCLAGPIWRNPPEYREHVNVCARLRVEELRREDLG